MGHDCGKHGFSARIGVKFKVTIAITITFSVTVSIGGVATYKIFGQTKPSFFIQNATIYQFNLSSSSPDCHLSSLMRVSVSSLNPSGRVALYYDRLGAHAAYMDQPITLPAALAPGYQGHKDVSVWSPYLSGATLSVAPQVADALLHEQAAGFMRLHVKFQCSMWRKIGGWTSGRYRLGVTCPAVFAFQNIGGAPGGSGGAVSVSVCITDPDVFRFQGMSPCSVNI